MNKFDAMDEAYIDIYETMDDSLSLRSMEPNFGTTKVRMIEAALQLIEAKNAMTDDEWNKWVESREHGKVPHIDRR